MSQKKSLSPILRATSLLGSVQVLHVLISIVRNKLTAIFIGMEGMGLADLYYRAIEFLGQATNFGIAFSAVRGLSDLHENGSWIQQRRYVRLIRSWTLTLAVLGMLICLLAAPILSRFSVGGNSITLGFMRLSPMVAFLTLTGGELAILKATRQIKTIARNTAIGAFITLITTAVFYGWLGMRGIIPVLLTSTCAIFLLNLWSTTRNYPYHITFAICFLKEGHPLIRLGIAYIGAGILGSGTELLIRNFVISYSNLSTAGLYAAGLTLTVSYARIIFSAMDADYFPRLSAQMGNKDTLSHTVNRQIEVLVLLMSPFLIIFSLCMPLVVRLLYTPDFMGAIPMVICALSYMFFKSVYAPIAYLSLAKGDSVVYFIMELIYDVVFCASVVVGFYFYGLIGAGFALSLANLIDLILLWTIYHHRYGYSMDASTWMNALAQYILLGGVLLLCSQENLWLRFGLGPCLFAASVGLSYHLLSKETNIFNRFKK